MQNDKNFVPYESLAHAEAKEIVSPDILPSCLRDLTAEQRSTIQDLVANGYLCGITMGRVMFSDIGVTPISEIEAYFVGYDDGQKS